MAAEGIRGREAAKQLDMSYGALLTHREQLMAKLGARTIQHAVMIGIREGLIPPPNQEAMDLADPEGG